MTERDQNPDFEPFEDTLDTNAAETAGTPEPDVSQPAGDLSADDEIIKLRRERDEYYQKLLRATADYRNSQRRLESDKHQAVQYANSSLIKELLTVIDNFERGLAVDPEKTDVPSLLSGMQMVHDELLRVLKRANVEEIAPEPGDPFDPELHNALMQQPTDQYDVPTVTQLLQKGYTHHGRTLRPAGVAVSRTE